MTTKTPHPFDLDRLAQLTAARDADYAVLRARLDRVKEARQRLAQHRATRNDLLQELEQAARLADRERLQAKIDATDKTLTELQAALDAAIREEEVASAAWNSSARLAERCSRFAEELGLALPGQELPLRGFGAIAGI